MNYLEHRRSQKLKSKKELVKDRAGRDLAKQKPIPKISAKRAEENVEYEKVKRELRKEAKDKCQVKSPVCNPRSPRHPQHKVGRIGKRFTKKEKMVWCCDACNGYIVEHPLWAIANGFEELKLGPSDKRGHLFKQS